MTTEEIVKALESINRRIDLCFDEDADRYQADKGAALDEVSDQVTALLVALAPADGK